MKIDPTLKTVAPGAIHDERVRHSKVASEPEGKPRDEVKISSLSAQLQEIEAGLERGQAVDHARVAEVKRAIAEGRFEVNSEKIADRLIHSTQEFLRAHKS
jgi:negative regulator of flagellin synthesis FlgM